VKLSNGRMLRIEVKKSKRAKQYWLKANVSEIYLIAPTVNYEINQVMDIASSVIVSDNLSKITFHVTDRRKYKDDLKQWYFEQTRRIVSERLDLIRIRNPSLPAYNKVSIKNQRSRWASCSENGNLNFNLILAALPIEIIDYVIIHELAHLIELNHSNDFWNIVKMTDPEFQTHRKLLHKYRYEL